MRLFLLQTCGLCIGGVALGFVLNATSGRPVNLLRPIYAASDSGIAVCGGSPDARHEEHGHRRMPLGEAVDACVACTVGFVDARGAAAFAAGHIPGAVHLPPAGHHDAQAALERLRAFPAIVVYDSGGCGLAEGVADRLTGLGFSDVRLLEGNWDGWQTSGGPAQSGACLACEAVHDRGSAAHAEGLAP